MNITKSSNQGTDYNLVLAKIIPNARELLKSSPAGVPIISLIVTAGMMEKESLVLRKGEKKIHSWYFNRIRIR